MKCLSPVRRPSVFSTRNWAACSHMRPLSKSSLSHFFFTQRQSKSPCTNQGKVIEHMMLGFRRSRGPLRLSQGPQRCPTAHHSCERRGADLGQGEDLVDEGADGQVAGECAAGDDHDDVAAPLAGAAAVQLPHPAVLQLQPPQLPAHPLIVCHSTAGLHTASADLYERRPRDCAIACHLAVIHMLF